MADESTNSNWTEIRLALEAVLDLEPSERPAALQQLESLHPDVALRVRSLLARNNEPGLFVPDHPIAAVAEEFGLTSSPKSGTLIGKYTVVRSLGSGGMGSVYEATDHALGRIVAVKVIHPAMVSRHALRDFEHEAKLLARLRHPAIAQVYETGMVPGGLGDSELLPFISMEFVPDALTLTAYADRHALGFRQRLHLILQVLDAVQHAHQRGVIHRDLKPANILVDGSGHPKVIDFGIARSQEAATLATATGRTAGTLRYMSPEQCSFGQRAGNAPDARSDIYGIGVVLYELLEGRSPYPSAQSGALGSLVDEVRYGRLAPARLAIVSDAITRRDLRAVLAKALACDPAERYSTAAALADDLERLILHEPVNARPSSLVQDARLFTRRNRALVIACAAVLASLSVGAVSATVGLIRARQAQALAELESARARRIAEFFGNTIRSMNVNIRPAGGEQGLDAWIFGSAPWGPARSSGEAARAVDILRRASEKLPSEFRDDPLAMARIAVDLSGASASLYQRDLAISNARAAWNARRKLLGDQDDETLKALVLYAGSLDDGQEKLEGFKQSLPRLESRFGRADPRCYELRMRAIDSMINNGDIAGAMSLLDASIAIASADSGPDAWQTWKFRLARAGLLTRSPNPQIRAEGTSGLDEALQALERLLGRRNEEVSGAYGLLGSAHAIVDDARSVNYFRASLDIDESLFGPASGVAYELRSALYAGYLRLHRLAEAEAIAREQVRNSREALGDEAFATVKAKARLARVLLLQKRELAEAEALARQASQDSLAYDEKIPSGDFSAYFRAIWAQSLRMQGDARAAETLVRPLIAARVGLNWGVWVDGFLWLQLGDSLMDQGRQSEAAQALDAAESFLVQLKDPSHPMVEDLAGSRRRLRELQQSAPPGE